MKMVNVFLSHDVDYSITGPSREHIMERKNRFDVSDYNYWLNFNTSLYYNIQEVMEIEYNLGVRSTFFFRPYYETGKLEDYRGDISLLCAGGWEVGLHINDWRNIDLELKRLQEITPIPIQGSRCHFLKYAADMYPVLKEHGIKYDSSIMYGKLSTQATNTKIYDARGIFVFPITLMDAYMFTYQNVNEYNIISRIKEAIELTEQYGNLLTISWHDSSLKMVGGRMYKKVLEYLLLQGCNIMTGIKAHDKAQKN